MELRSLAAAADPDWTLGAMNLMRPGGLSGGNVAQLSLSRAYSMPSSTGPGHSTSMC